MSLPLSESKEKRTDMFKETPDGKTNSYEAIAMERAEQIDREFYKLYGSEESSYNTKDVLLLTGKIAQLILDGVRPRDLNT